MVCYGMDFVSWISAILSVVWIGAVLSTIVYTITVKYQIISFYFYGCVMNFNIVERGQIFKCLKYISTLVFNKLYTCDVRMNIALFFLPHTCLTHLSYTTISFSLYPPCFDGPQCTKHTMQRITNRWILKAPIKIAIHWNLRMLENDLWFIVVLDFFDFYNSGKIDVPIKKKTTHTNFHASHVLSKWNHKKLNDLYF